MGSHCGFKGLGFLGSHCGFMGTHCGGITVLMTGSLHESRTCSFLRCADHNGPSLQLIGLLQSIL